MENVQTLEINEKMARKDILFSKICLIFNIGFRQNLKIKISFITYPISRYQILFSYLNIFIVNIEFLQSLYKSLWFPFTIHDQFVLNQNF